MAIWETSPVDQQPEILLTDWKLVKITQNNHFTLHFVGYCPQNLEGRVSSAITEMENIGEEIIGKTHSGRVYRTQGQHGYSEEAEYVLQLWCERYNVKPHEIEDFKG